MLSTFTMRCQNFIWFLIFTFTLYCMPHLELLLPYQLHFMSEAEAAEPTPPSEAQTTAPGQEGSATTSGAETSPQADISTSYSSERKDGNPTEDKKGQPPETMDSLSEQGQVLLAPNVSFKVDDFTGAGHLSYPIIVPPARGGLSPQISLNYSSSGGNGWIGVGWDLSLGFIERKGARKAVPKYNGTDSFELNLSGASQDLVPIGGDEYRFKIEGAYLKIKYYPSENYWEIWDKSGTKMRFGAPSSSNSKIGTVKEPDTGSNTYRWCLDRVQDSKGNYMEIVYIKDQEGTNTYQIYPQEIKYNGQMGDNFLPNHRVIFNLTARAAGSDYVYNYRGGFQMLTRKLLSSIETKTNGSLVRKYVLAYSTFNARSLLTSITPYGYTEQGQESSLPPAIYTYQTHNPGFQQQMVSWTNVYDGWYIRRSDFGGIRTDLVDMNGDGLPDRVRYSPYWPYNNNYWMVYLNNGQGFNQGVDWPNAVNGDYIRNNDFFGTWADLVDMNGDGLPDRVVADRSSPYDTWTVYYNNGHGFGQGVNWPNLDSHVSFLS